MIKSDLKTYRQICTDNPDIPIFCKDWYLDAVCGPNNWTCYYYEEQGRTLSAWPVYLKKMNNFFMTSQMPHLTQFLSPWIDFSDCNSPSKKIDRINKVQEHFAKHTHNISYISTKLSPKMQNLLGLHWNGFQSKVNYTYKLFDIKQHSELLNSFSNTNKRYIKKYKNRATIKEINDPELLYKKHEQWLQQQGKSISYDKEFICQLFSECNKRDASKILWADVDGELLAAILLIWDASCAYHLITTVSPNTEHRGINSFLVFEAIKEMSSFVDCYDFEGSMLRGVEYYYRSFGSTQTAYYTISKSNSIAYNFKLAIKTLMGKM